MRPFSATLISLLGMSTKPRFSVIRPLEREAERNVEVMWLTVKETTSRGFMLGFINNGVGDTGTSICLH